MFNDKREVLSTHQPKQKNTIYVGEVQVVLKEIKFNYAFWKSLYKGGGVDLVTFAIQKKKLSLGDEITSEIYVLFKQVKDITIGVNTGLTNSRIPANQTEKAEAVHFHTEDRHSRDCARTSKVLASFGLKVVSEIKPPSY